MLYGQFLKILFFSSPPPLKRGRGKKLKFKYCQNFIFDVYKGTIYFLIQQYNILPPQMTRLPSRVPDTVSSTGRGNKGTLQPSRGRNSGSLRTFGSVELSIRSKSRILSVTRLQRLRKALIRRINNTIWR